MRLNSAIFADMERASASIKLRGFPAFPDGISSSTPLNATPFLINIDKLVELPGDSWRLELVRRFLAVVEELRTLGAFPLAAIVGGSFLDMSRKPNDFDCVIFYEEGFDAGVALLESQARWRKSHIDVRYIPFDRDPIVSIKVSVYFGALYSATKTREEWAKAALLVDLREFGKEP